MRNSANTQVYFFIRYFRFPFEKYCPDQQLRAYRMTIRVETSKSRIVDNFQDHDIPEMQLRYFRRLAAQFPNARQRTEPSALFNCHGLTFATRRTKILDRQNIQRILDDDGWREVQVASVLPGDIIIYFDEAGDPNHSGIVVSDRLSVPQILSKWGIGGEYIHWPADVPNFYGPIQKYYRCYL